MTIMHAALVRFTLINTMVFHQPISLGWKKKVISHASMSFFTSTYRLLCRIFVEFNLDTFNGTPTVEPYHVIMLSKTGLRRINHQSHCYCFSVWWWMPLENWKHRVNPQHILHLLANRQVSHAQVLFHPAHPLPSLLAINYRALKGFTPQNGNESSALF